ncbi:MAG: hypothetical protein NTU85_03500 [Candidatus Kaiserbacteria bacterium]|nr:hypothetical protein [Candidatus Kaiserbacteria bacterium]
MDAVDAVDGQSGGLRHGEGEMMGQEELARWRAGRVREETLPSGLVVTVKRAELLDLVADGAIPLPLLGLVEQLGTAEAVTTGISLGDWPRYAPLVNAVARAVLVAPAVADAPDDTHLGITELPMVDRLAVFNLAVGDLQRVATFRDEPHPGVAAALPGEDLRGPAERDSGAG